MEVSENKATGERLEARQVGSPRRATSLPLLVFGFITLIFGFVVLIGEDAIEDFVFGAIYWAAAFPVGFGVLFWLEHRRASRNGVVEGLEPYGWYALGGLILIPVGFLLTVIAPLVWVATALLAVAVRQRNRYLAICAVVFGFFGTLEFPPEMISNRLFDVAYALGFFESKYGYFNWAGELFAGLLAAFLLIAGGVAWRRETRPASDTPS